MDFNYPIVVQVQTIFNVILSDTWKWKSLSRRREGKIKQYKDSERKIYIKY